MLNSVTHTFYASKWDTSKCATYNNCDSERFTITAKNEATNHCIFCSRLGIPDGEPIESLSIIMTNDQSATPKYLRRAYTSNSSIPDAGYTKSIRVNGGVYYIHVRDDQKQTVSHSGLRQFPLLNGVEGF